jgi:hypothetical protein
MGMTLSEAVNLVTMASLPLAVFAVWWGVRTYRGQMNAQLFLAFTERYENIICNAPAEFRAWRLNPNATPLAVTQDVRTSILAYLNLCSEEHYLWQNGYLDHAIWRIWSDELERTLRSDLLRREWPKLKEGFQSYGHFCEFVDRAQAKPVSVGTS